MSAPRIPNDINFWKKKGKSGKDVCIYFHDDLDGLTSGCLMKKYLLEHGFTIKQAGVINYQQSWKAFNIDKSLINIAVDFSEDCPDIDIYIDHHGVFDDETKLKQKRYSIKVKSDSAATGIAKVLGMPLSSEVSEWIDMIDSANYGQYKIDVTKILNMDLSEIKRSHNPKLYFASCFNQQIKRGDIVTLLEVFNAAKEPSLYEFYRLFKVFYAKNNIDWISGEEVDFSISAQERMIQVNNRGRGRTKSSGGDQFFDKDGKLKKGLIMDSRGRITKKIYASSKEFFKDFKAMRSTEASKKDPSNPNNFKYKLSPKGYQIIGNMVFVPPGTWLNPIRIKSLVTKDRRCGIIDNQPINFVMLQYGNTIQVTDFDVRLDDVKNDDYPVAPNKSKIRHLGDYMTGLVKIFEDKADYNDQRTFSGGHKGIGTISNIFGSYDKNRFFSTNYDYLDLLKNKVIIDLSGVGTNWDTLTMWNNDNDEDSSTFTDEAINTRLKNVDTLRSEKDVENQALELEMLNFIINNRKFISKEHLAGPLKNNFKYYKQLYELWLDEGFNIICDLSPDFLTKIRYWNSKRPEEAMYLKIISSFVSKVVKKYKLNEFYLSKDDRTTQQTKQRKVVKHVFKLMFNLRNNLYIDDLEATRKKYHKWKPVRPSKVRKTLK